MLLHALVRKDWTLQSTACSIKPICFEPTKLNLMECRVSWLILKCVVRQMQLVCQKTRQLWPVLCKTLEESMELPKTTEWAQQKVAYTSALMQMSTNNHQASKLDQTVVHIDAGNLWQFTQSSWYWEAHKQKWGPSYWNKRTLYHQNASTSSMMTR